MRLSSLLGVRSSRLVALVISLLLINCDELSVRCLPMSVAAVLSPTTHDDIVQQRHSLQVRSSSEDTALNIFSMYSSGHSNSADSDRLLSCVVENPETDEIGNDSNFVVSTLMQTLQLQDQQPSQTDPGEQMGLSKPAPGEDTESFHIRSTYAQLELHGVPGDGFQDGMELTRTRSNAVRTKMDSNFRTSPEDELRFLSMVDRYGFYLPPTSQIDRVAVLPAAPFAKKLSPVPSPSKSAPVSPLRAGVKIPPLPRTPSPAPPNLTVPKHLLSQSRSASPISLHSHSRSHSQSNSPSPSSANPPPPRHETSRLSKWHRMLIPLPEPMHSHVCTSNSYPQWHSSSSSPPHSRLHSPSTSPSTERHSHPTNKTARNTTVYGGGSVLYWTVNPKKEHKFRERIYKGVPDAWRAAAWGVLIEKFAGVQRDRFEILKRDYFVCILLLIFFFLFCNLLISS